MAIYDYSLFNLEQSKSLLEKNFLDNYLMSPEPTMSILGGQPAAGKSRLISMVSREQAGGVPINGDAYRNYHPNYRTILSTYKQEAPTYTQSFSNALVEFMKEECFRRKLNFIIEGTMRTYHVIENTAKVARQHKFRVEAHALVVSSDESYLGIYQRYEGEIEETGFGRFSALNTHDEAYKQMPVNIQQACEKCLFDKMTLYCRNANEELDTVGQWNFEGQLSLKVPNFQTLFNELRQPIYPRAYYQEQWLMIKEQAQKRGETDQNYLDGINKFIRWYR
jgi:Zeta toxin